MKCTFKVHIVQCRDSTEEYAVRLVGWQIQEERKANAGINLTGYHPPPELTPGPLFFPSKSLPWGQLFSTKLRPLGRENETKPQGIICLLQMTKKKHSSMRAVSFQISVWQFSFVVRIEYFQVFIQHLRLILFEVWRQFENHSHCGKPRYSSVTVLTCAIDIFLRFWAD